MSRRISENTWPRSAYPETGFIRLVFSAGTVFFSHNNLTRIVFFSQFQSSFVPANGANNYARTEALWLVSSKEKEKKERDGKRQGENLNYVTR